MIKKLLKTLAATTAFLVLLSPTVAHAAGSATVSFGGPTTVVNGQNIAITANVASISGTAGGGIGNIQGTFVWDPAYLQYVSFSSGVAWPITFSSASAKYYGVDGGSGPISTNTTLFTVTFKAIQSGTTSVLLSGNAMGDGLAGAVSLTNPSARSITITEPVTLSGNNYLSDLGVSGYTISPAFNKTTGSYTLTVPNSAASVIVNATKEDSSASVSGTGSKALSVGSNTVNVIVTAEDGTPRTYTINIVRESAVTPPPPAKSSDATLKSLDVGGYGLSPGFSKDNTNYTITVPAGISGLDVSALANDPKATVTVTGNTGWGSGTNNITIRVTAEDGSVKTYIVTVKRPDAVNTNKSSNNYLKELKIKSYPVDFKKTTNSYSITVPYEIDKLDLSALAESSKAKVEIIGNKDFKVGEVNVVEIRVTAEDGSLRIYTINVTRSAAASKNKLASLEVKDHVFTPKFDPAVEEYYLTVGYWTKDLEVLFKTQDKDAKVEIIGNTDLKVGTNIITVKVTDANGFVRTYTIYVEREPFTIFGLNPFLFFGLLGLLLLGLILLIILLKRRKKEEPEEIVPAEPVPNNININVNPSFTPDVNIGSQNNSDFASDQAKLARGKDAEIGPDRMLVDAKEADVVNGVLADDYDIDELMSALKNKDQDKLRMFVNQVKANDLKDELKGLDPDRFDNIFDDEVTVHEVVRAMEKWNKTRNPKELNMLMAQYAANQLKAKTKGRGEVG